MLEIIFDVLSVDGYKMDYFSDNFYQNVKNLHPL